MQFIELSFLFEIGLKDHFVKLPCLFLFKVFPMEGNNNPPPKKPKLKKHKTKKLADPPQHAEVSIKEVESGSFARFSFAPAGRISVTRRRTVG